MPDSHIFKFNRKSHKFDEFQTVLTPYTAFSIESFHIGSDGYFAIGNHLNVESNFTESEIVKFDPQQNKFVHFQPIYTHGCRHILPLHVDGKQLLISSNFFNTTSSKVFSEVYSYNAASDKFEYIQSLPSLSVVHHSGITFGSETFLFMSNFYNGQSYKVKSEIFKWDAQAQEFVHLQFIRTKGVRESNFFVMDNDLYLAVANSHDGTTYMVDSIIYKYCDGQFSIE